MHCEHIRINVLTMYTQHAFLRDLSELLHLELRSDYLPAEMRHLNLLAEEIRVKLAKTNLEASIDHELWECLSGFELAAVDPIYRKEVVQRALQKLESLEESFADQ